MFFENKIIWQDLFLYLQVFYKLTAYSATNELAIGWKLIFHKLSIDWSPKHLKLCVSVIHLCHNGFQVCPWASLLYTLLHASTVNIHFSLCARHGHTRAYVQSPTAFLPLIIPSPTHFASSGSWRYFNRYDHSHLQHLLFLVYPLQVEQTVERYIFQRISMI